MVARVAPDASADRDAHRARRLSRPLAVLALAASLAACEEPQVATTVERFAAASAQTAQVATAVPEAPAVKVLDQNGEPMGGVAVAFSVSQGAGAVSTPSATTNSQGVASAGSWTLGTLAGANAVTATVAGLTPLGFQASGTAGPPAAVAFQSGGGQQARVGQAVGARPTARVADAFDNPTAGVEVVFEVAMGGGQVTGSTQTTNASGLATVGGWTLGQTVGENRLRARIPGGATATVSAQSTPGEPATLTKEAGDGQSAQVDTDVAVAPAVRVEDTFGNAVPGVTVTFEAGDASVREGAVAPAGTQGTVEPTSATTDVDGVATTERWTLGTTAGENTLVARTGGLSVAFTATATAGPAVSMASAAGNGQSAPAGTAVAVAPAVIVTDAFDNPVPGVSVTFVVLSGGGSVQDATRQTGANGIATVGGWTLGATPGANTMEARLDGFAPVLFSATATLAPGPPASVSVFQGDGQSAPVGTAVPVRPAVVVRDAGGNVLTGISVTWVVVGGGGSVSGGNTVTNATGVATVGSWTLGPAAGTNTLQARVSGLAAASFTATGTGGGGGGGSFDIEVRFLGGLTPSQQAIFSQAAARWEAIIVGDLSDFNLNIAAGSCGEPSIPATNERVDDVLIFAAGVAIDGVGKVLGQAGPCSIRNSDGLPIYGRMKFDDADLASLEASGRLLNVILHEMGHVLGIGSLWDFPPFFTLLTGKNGADPFFTGPGGIAAFDAVGGSSYTGNKVPVENTGGAGTRDSHWRESIFASELMTGFLSAGANPLSAVTVASLADMGYAVNASQADAYTLPPIIGAPPREEIPPLRLLELPMPPPIVVGPDGLPVGGPGGP